MFGELDITDRGGADDTPFVYALQRGTSACLRPTIIPTRPCPMKSERPWDSASTARPWLSKNNLGPQLMAFVNVEPFTTMFPEAGPNAHLFMRKIRKVFDPNSVASPGRQVFTEEEWQQFPKEVKDLVNQMRGMQGLPAVK